MQAPLPSLPIERGRPGPGLLAHVAVAKYADGLPLHRQSAIYAREGDRSRPLHPGGLDGPHGRIAATRWFKRSGGMSAPGRCCTPTTPLWRFSPRDWAAPGSDGCGRRCAMSGHWPEQRRRRRSTATRPIGGPSMHEALLGSAAASCMPTAMADSTAYLRMIRRPDCRA